MANIFCPLNLIMLLHYHTTPEPYSKENPLHAESNAVREGRAMLLEAEMIQPRSGDVNETTEKGAAFISHLMTIPFPEREWVIPAQRSRDTVGKENG